MVATDGFPEHNCQALPVGDTAQAVVAQRSKFIGAPSRNKFWAPQECKQGRSIRKKTIIYRMINI